MKRQNDRSQNQRGNQNASQRGNQNKSQRAAPSGTPGDDAVARSEQRLDEEERSLVGNTREDRNLTGSTTYVTLPEQQGDQATNREPRNASGSQSSRGRGGSGRSRSSRSTDRDTPR